MGSPKLELTPDQQEKIDRELEAGESILWVGGPKPKFFTKTTVGSFLFGIPFTTFAIFWITMAANGVWGAGKNIPGLFKLFPLFGVPFVCVGLGLLSSPLWAYLRSSKTTYVITDQRVLVFSGIRSVTIRSTRPDSLQEYYRTDHLDGTGDVCTEGVNLLRVQDPHLVEKLIRALGEQYNPHEAINS